MITRIIVSIVLLVSILILPYWFYLPLLFIAVFLLPFFWEGLILAFLIDILYGAGFDSLVSIFSPLNIAVAVSLIVLMPIKERIRSHV